MCILLYLNHIEHFPNHFFAFVEDHQRKDYEIKQKKKKKKTCNSIQFENQNRIQFFGYQIFVELSLSNLKKVSIQLKINTIKRY